MFGMEYYFPVFLLTGLVISAPFTPRGLTGRTPGCP